MKVWGVQLERPGPWGLTAAVGIGAVLWVTWVVSGLGPRTKVAAGGMLVAMLWGTISASVGIHAARAGRHLALNVLGCTAVMLVYAGVIALVGE